MNITSRLLCSRTSCTLSQFRLLQTKSVIGVYHFGGCQTSRLLDTEKRCQQQQLTNIRQMRRWTEKTLREIYWRGRSFDKIPEPERPRSAWQDWNYHSELYAFAQRLQEPSLSQEVLTKTFTHRSYVEMQQIEREKLGIQDVNFETQTNVDLIEKGQQITEQYVKRYLRYHLRDVPEECIQSISRHLMSTPVLADISKWIGCIDLINCAEFPPSEQTLSDTVLALVGTIANQTGLKRAHNFLIDFILTYLNGADLMEIWDFASLDLDLNQYLHTKGLPQYEPRILYRSSTGTFEACYVVGLYCDQKLIGQAPGESASIARKMAELDSFRNLFGLTPSKVRFQYGPPAYDLDLSRFDKENFSFDSSLSDPTVIHGQSSTNNNNQDFINKSVN